MTHLAVHDVVAMPASMTRWQQVRNRKQFHWLAETIAEGTGAFLYTFAGTGATASFVLGNILQIPGLGSLLQIGLAYAVGIALAMAVCFPTSHGQFNPAITIHAAVVGKMPVLKAARYIFAQIFGSYIACLLIYVQYKQDITIAIEALQAKGLYDTVMFTSSGPGGIFGLYVPATANLAFVLLNEFVCDFVVALVIFSCSDPGNPISTPTTMPWIIALAYGVIVWGFAPVGLAANSARDLGGRFAAMTLFGGAASGGKYAALSALTNIPATLVAGVFYSLVFADSTRSTLPSPRISLPHKLIPLQTQPSTLSGIASSLRGTLSSNAGGMVSRHPRSASLKVARSRRSQRRRESRGVGHERRLGGGPLFCSCVHLNCLGSRDTLDLLY
ncbi:aquaporin-like protein [Lenzites betulinus]|nr:aquaporin-like protein [Lenzites betulinus]